MALTFSLAFTNDFNSSSEKSSRMAIEGSFVAVSWAHIATGSTDSAVSAKIARHINVVTLFVFIITPICFSDLSPRILCLPSYCRHLSDSAGTHERDFDAHEDRHDVALRDSST